MNADVTQLLFYAGFTVLGWWLRHKGLLGPKPVPANGSPPPAGTPADWKTVVDLLKALLDRLSQQPTAAK